jgi:hypothetical protein
MPRGAICHQHLGRAAHNAARGLAGNGIKGQLLWRDDPPLPGRRATFQVRGVRPRTAAIRRPDISLREPRHRHRGHAGSPRLRVQRTWISTRLYDA